MKMQSLPLRAQKASGRGIISPADKHVDRAARQRTIETGIAAIEIAVPFNIDNVTEYLFAGTDQEHWSMTDDFPILTPPFEVMWFETHGPSNVISRDVPERYKNIREVTEIVSNREMLSLRWGVLWTSKKVIECALEGEHDGYRDEVARGRMLGAEWVVTATLCLKQSDGSILWPAAVHRFLVLPNGRAPDDGIVYVPGPVVDLFTVQGVSYADIERMALDAMSSNFFPTYLAVSFCHCKNIIREANLPSRVERRAEEKAGRIPVKYWTLHIQPFREVNAPHERPDGDPGARTKALHIVRGHFVNYSKEKPLFGKYSGTFWKPMHVRGDIHSGLVSKNYAVDPPKGE